MSKSFRSSSVFIVATLLGFASHAPAGIGVFDATILIGLGGEDKDPLIAGLLMFRLLYHLLPFVTGARRCSAPWKDGEACARSGRRLKLYTGELSLSPTIPATISVRQRIRTGSVDSLKISMPTMMLPAAPMPVQTA